MGKEITGVIIEKAYHPPPGAPDKYWCYVMVETEAGKRVNVRLHKKIQDKVTIGDKIRFAKPWRHNKPLRDVQHIGRAGIE
jgi:hypothetical protein